MTIGENIKKYRKEKGLTQKELAEKSNLSRSYLADLERDRYNPSLDSLQLIADSLNINVSNLLGEDSKDNKLAEQEKYIESIRLDTAEDAMKFILQQPSLMAFGGYDLNEMTEEEILDLANDMLFAMKLSLEKNKRK